MKIYLYLCGVKLKIESMNEIKLRPVLFRKWIPGVYEPDTERGYGTKLVKGTHCWEHEFTHEGMFHQWAAAYEEFETGAGNFTVALVELADGTIVEVLPSNIKFIG